MERVRSAASVGCLTGLGFGSVALRGDGDRNGVGCGGYGRDLVDTRRNIAGILLPLALASFVVLLIPIPAVQAYGPLVLLVGIIAAIIDSVIFGRQLSKKVKAKFPNGDNSGQSVKGSALGFYAFNRACLIRKWRVPRPRVDAGAKID